jgi:hypothetical protein
MPIVAGFPEFQDQVVNKFSEFFEALPALQEKLNDLTGEAHEAISAEHHLILNLGILVGISMMEIVLLSVNGFGPGAQKSARSLLEASVTAEYIRLHPEQYEDFVEWYHVERFKEIEFLRTYLPEASARLDHKDPELVASIQNEKDRVLPRFGARSSWCRHDLAERARQTGYVESYRTLNPVASGFVHVTPYGLHRRFDREDLFRIDVPPSVSWVEQSLVSGHGLTLGMVRTLVKCFHPESEEAVIGPLETDFVHAWPRIPDAE